jgi:hypothetical protein
MPGFRILLRLAPFVVGLVAVRVWLIRRDVGRRSLPAAAEARGIGPATARDAPKAASAGRFQRQPIDIVTVVDDLLLAGR